MGQEMKNWDQVGIGDEEDKPWISWYEGEGGDKPWEDHKSNLSTDPQTSPSRSRQADQTGCTNFKNCNCEQRTDPERTSWSDTIILRIISKLRAKSVLFPSLLAQERGACP